MGYSVYKHTFPNGKVYIGITCQDPQKRWRSNGSGYLRKNKNGEYVQPLIARAIFKYNWNNVQHEILYNELSKEEAEEKEIELIAKYRSNECEFGYNVANGGNTTGTVSEETKRKISNANKGKQISTETKEKISNTLKGHKLSDETKQKMSEARKGEKNWNYGKHLSEETRKKLSEANRGRIPSEETRKKISETSKGRKHPDLAEKNKVRCSTPVRCVETGIVYSSQREASEQTGINQANISSACNGIRNVAGGYHWEFVENKGE